MLKNFFHALLCLIVLIAQSWGAESPGAVPSNSPTGDSAATEAAGSPASNGSIASSDDLKQLRERIVKQEEEIRRLQQAVSEQRALLEKAIQASSTAAANPVNTVNVANASPVGQAPVQLVPAVDVKRPIAMQKEAKPSPLSIGIGNSTFTPFGFVDATFFLRSNTVGSGIGTNFGGIPFNNVPNGHLSETNFTAQNSRIGLRVDSNFLGWKILGYLETDFLFNNDANSYQITSNSAALRLRNYFVDVQKNGFEFLAGQDWSFLTPNRKGLSPLPSDLFYTQNMDTNYQVGLTWTRAPQFRFISHPNENIAFGVALENPQQYIGGGQGGSQSTLPSFLAGQSSFVNQFQFNEPLAAGSSITQVPNMMPDIIAKAAFDGKPHDRAMHLEVAGLVRGFKDYLPNTSTFNNPYILHGSHTAVGFGGAVNSNLEIFKNFRLIENAYFGEGTGRYIFGQAPDVVITPDGGIIPLHSYSTVDGFEAQVTPNTLLAAYYGGVYIGKTVIFDPTASGSTLARPVYVGYGYPGSIQNRAVQEITFDWVQTLWKNPNYGSLSLINQYSYLLREPWNLNANAPNKPHSNIFYVNLRYTLP